MMRISILLICLLALTTAARADGERTRETYPLLPMIFFDKDSSTLPARYVIFSDPTPTQYFVEDTITGTLNAYYNYLNILGKRLQSHPETTIEIVGCNSADSSLETSLALSRARAERVFVYLRDIWHIDPVRMKLSARGLPDPPSNRRTAQGIEENRRVEIISKDWDIIKPVVAVVDWKGYREPGERYELIRFKFDSYEMGKLNEQIFKETIMDRMTPAVEVKVCGYEDFLDPENVLGLRRAKQVVKLIKSSARFPINVTDAYPRPRYAQVTPEGRFFHRSVMIEILHPPRLRD